MSNTDILNPYRPGDIRWHDFIRIFTYKVANSTEEDGVSKGEILTINASGRLINPTTITHGQVNLTGGVFQALHKADEGADVQVAVAPSRIIMSANSGINVGQQVALIGTDGTGNNRDVEQSKVRIATLTDSVTQPGSGTATVHLQDYAYLGRVIEILNPATDGTKKSRTADDDRVTVELGVA